MVYTTEFCFIKGATSRDIDFRINESVCVSVVFDFFYSPTMFFESFMIVMYYISSLVITVFCLCNGTLLMFLVHVVDTASPLSL